MLSTNNFKRIMSLVGTIIFAGLVLTTMTQSVHAQNIASVRRAIVSNGKGSRVFVVDTTGRMPARESLLEITSLNDDGTLVGKYFPFKAGIPASTNVTGSITIAGGIAITFTVTDAAGFGVNETVFVGAIRLGGTRDLPFMAGTYTNTVSGGVSVAVGPRPFCAKLSSI